MEGMPYPLHRLASPVPVIEAERLSRSSLRRHAPELIDTAAFPMIDVSVVTHKSRRWFAEFFASLAAQSYPLEKINLIVTDHSPDDSEIEPLVHALVPLQARLRSCSLEHRENRGFGAGHNRGLTAGTAEFILVTNVDLAFEAETLARLVRHALTGPKTFVAWECRQKPYEHPKAYDILTQETPWCSGACLLLRRTALTEVKGFDDAFFMYGEDVDLSWRLRAKGGRLRYCPDAVVWHHTYAGPGEVKETQYFHGTRGNMFLRLRFGGPLDILIGFAMQASLLVHRQRFPGKFGKLFRGYTTIGAKAWHFLLTRPSRRRMGKAKVTFPGWDYAPLRKGAFVAPALLPRNQDERPLVSLIIRTYPGRLPLLHEALVSARLQTYRPLEVIVVEDGGSTAAASCARLGHISDLDMVHYAAPRRGRGYTGNIGLALARGDYISFLDDDDLLFADHIEALAGELLKGEARAAHAYAWEVETVFTPEKWLPYREAAPQSRLDRPFDRPRLWRENYIPIQAVLFDRSLYETYGGFAEDLESLEDWDLWQRYALAGDFATVAKTTSLFRMPADPAARLRRMRAMHEHYAAAAARQEAMPWCATVADLRRATGGDRVLETNRWKERLARVPGLYPIWRAVRRRAEN